MRKLTSGLAAAVAGLFGMAGSAAAQCNCVYVEPCTITSNIADFTSGTERTMCTVRPTGGYWSIAYNLTTVSGRQYRIENPMTYFAGWFINGDAGLQVDTGDPAHPCYRTPRLQICFGP